MNPLITKWVAALRSGQYKQGYELLKIDAHCPGLDGSITTEDRYCCLGVLIEVAGETMPPCNERETSRLPSCIHLQLPDWMTIGKMVDLARRNDAGASFRKIANEIETMAKEQEG